MRKYLLDGHTHTLACGHGYSTLTELVQGAVAANLEMMCMTEHAPGIPGAPGAMFFSNYRIIPREIMGVKLLLGIESNILDTQGNLDVPKRALEKNRLDIISASLHEYCIPPTNKKDHTEAVMAAMNHSYVDFICHLGNPNYPIDIKAVVAEAKKTNTMIEINNGSIFIRWGSLENCVEIAKECVAQEVPMIVGSDAHYHTDVGRFPYVDKIMDLAQVPDELIVNLDCKRLTDYLKAKGRKLFANPRETADDLFKD